MFLDWVRRRMISMTVVFCTAETQRSRVIGVYPHIR